MFRHIAIASAAFGILSASAWALPRIDDPAAVASLLNMGSGFDLLFPDDGLRPGGTPDDGNVVYFPWKRLALNMRNGEPVFGLAYTRKGVLLSAELMAGIDTEVVQREFDRFKETLPEPRRNLLRIAPVPVRRGVYRAMLQDQGGNAWVLGTTEVEQAIPPNVTAVSILLNKRAADLVILALQGQASVGFSYAYDFPARTTPYEADVRVDWKTVRELLSRQQNSMLTFAENPIPAVSASAIVKLTRKLIEDKHIEVDPPENVERAVLDVSKIVIARTFRSIHPNPFFPDLKLPPAQNNWTNNLILGMDFRDAESRLSGWNMGLSSSYQVNEMRPEELVTESLSLTAYPYQIVSATAGMQFGGLCRSHPHLFRYEGVTAEDGTQTILPGCPDRLLPHEGIALTPESVPSPLAEPPQPPNPTIPGPIFGQ